MVNRIVKRMIGLLARRVFPKLQNRAVPTNTFHTDLAVDIVTTWDTRCGIAAYSSFLVAELKKDISLRIVEVSNDHVISPYYLLLGYKTGKSPNLIHVQFAYGMFGNLPLGKKKTLTAFTSLLFYLGLAMSDNRVVTTFHEVMKNMHAGGAIGLVYVKLLNKLVCSTSDMIIVHTRESKELMQRIYHVPEARIKIIPLGTIEHPTFLNRETCKKQLNLEGKTVITLPGFVSRRKGLDLVVEILPHLDRDIQLLIAGGTREKDDVDYFEKLISLAKQHDCLDRITFEDSFPIPAAVMNATDIAILPYLQATESMMLRTLIAYQIPTITSDVQAFREIKAEFGCIELFKNKNKQDLLEKLVALMTNSKKQSYLKKQCLKMWNETKWSSMAAKHLDTYLEVMAAHPTAMYNEQRQKERLDWLKANVSSRTMEIGCATGYITEYVGADVGLDLNQFRIRFAKKKYSTKDFIVASAEFLPFKDNAWDMVLVPEILEHVPLRLAEKIVSETLRVSQKILITLPNAEKTNYDKAIVENPEHKWYPTKDSVNSLLRNPILEYTQEKDFILVRGFSREPRSGNHAYQDTQNL